LPSLPFSGRDFGAVVNSILARPSHSILTSQIRCRQKNLVLVPVCYGLNLV
jgi:hypothetical protein